MESPRYKWLIAGIIGALPVYWGMVADISPCSGLDRQWSDKSAFDYAHHLPRGYTSKLTRNLTIMQQGLVAYCQHHKGSFPPMQDARQTRRALHPYIHAYLFRSVNPATGRLLQPNARLAGRTFRQAGPPDQILAFYDEKPPNTYTEVYYITLGGQVGHVSEARWPAIKRHFR